MAKGFAGTATTTDAISKGVSSMAAVLSDEHTKWLEERGLDPEITVKYGLYTDRQSPGGRDLVIPYHRNGEIINRKYRGPQKRSVRKRALRGHSGTKIASGIPALRANH
jgi:hypothetical protein